MDSTPFPSLKYLTIRKLALVTYNNSINYFFGEVPLTEKYNIDDPFNVNLKEENWIVKSEEEARNYIDQRLPKVLEDEVVHLLRPIIDEIHYWIRDHFHIIRHVERTHYKNSLCWKKELIIDRIKVAKLFVQNESIDKRVRFIMACIYFWETDILHLWQSLTVDERQSIFELNPNISVYFWLKWCKKGAKSPRTRYVQKYLTYDRLCKIKNTSRVRLSSFFLELNKRNKIYFLKDLFYTKRGHIDDLLRCFNLLDEFDRADTIPTYLRPIDVLCCYLNWPLQSHFLNAINEMKSYLRRYSYEYGMEYILYRKLMRGMQDFDYQLLLRGLWNLTPDTFKQEIQRKNTFAVAQIAMSYDKNTHPLPIKEVLLEHLRRTDIFLD